MDSNSAPPQYKQHYPLGYKGRLYKLYLTGHCYGTKTDMLQNKMPTRYLVQSHINATNEEEKTWAAFRSVSIYLMFVIIQGELIQGELIQGELKVAVQLFCVGSRFRMAVKLTECIDG
jgi:hypothetical protein